MNLIDEHMILKFKRVPETGTTLTDPREMQGCAWGLAVALAQQATKEAA